MKKQIRVVVGLIASFIFGVSPFMEILVGATDDASASSAMNTYELRADSNTETLPFPVVLRDFNVDNIIFDGDPDNYEPKYWYIFGMVNQTLDASKKPSFTDKGYHYLVETAQQEKIKIPDMDYNGWIDDKDKELALQEAKDWYKTVEGKSYEEIKADWENSTYRYVVYHANQLFNDVEGLNLRKEDQLSLTKNQNGVYAYYDSAYFPLDNQLFGNTHEWCKNSPDPNYPCDHNYHFTLESHTKFYYDGESELYFEFLGDDVWVYVNNQLVIDIGGVHGELPQKFVIREGGKIYRTGIQGQESKEELVSEIPGAGWYDFDFYFMERHINQSNLKISTNMEFNPDIKIEKIPYLKGENNQEIPLKENAVVYPGQTIYYKFQIENSGNVDLTNVILEDPKLGLIVKSDDVYISNERIESEDAYQIKIGDSEGDLSAFKKLSSKDSHPFNIIEISSESFNYVVTNDDAVIGEVINQATVTGTYENSNVTKFSKAEVSVDVVPLPSLSLEKIVIGSENEDDLFTIQVQGSDGTAFNVRLEAGETVTLEPMKYGVTYTIKEIVPMNYTLKDISGDINEKYEVSVTTDQQDYKVVITNEVTNTKWFQFKTRVENFVAQVKDKFHGEEGSK